MSPNLGSPMHASSRLPEGWTVPEVVEDTIVAGDVPLHRAGIATTAPTGEEVCGSAADRSGSALARARYELLERASAFESARAVRASYRLLDASGDTVGDVDGRDVFPSSDAPERWMYSRSNGIALHSTWAVACRRALWELAERDRILRSWHGEIAPEHLEIPHEQLPAIEGYEWRVCAFPEPRTESFSAGIEVVGAFGFPLRDERPFVLGLGARSDRRDAVDAALAESLQMLAFLWEEPVPSTLPEPQPTAMFHLDTFQALGQHERVRRWLEGEHASFGVSERRSRPVGRLGFVDLTPPWLDDGLRVAKAICPEATPLVFGDSPFARHLPSELRVHPIP
jgi:hypothetical protein